MLGRPIPLSASCRSGGSPGEPLPLWATGGCKRSRQAGGSDPTPHFYQASWTGGGIIMGWLEGSFLALSIRTRAPTKPVGFQVGGARGL